MKIEQCLKLGISLLVTLALAACNGGNNSNINNSSSTTTLQAYINSLAFTPPESKQLTAPPVSNQQSFTTPGGLTINSVDIKFYSGANCTESLVYVNTLVGAVTPAAGTYTSTNKSNNALCTNYVNDKITPNSSGCSGLYEDMSKGNMRSVQYTYNIDNGSGGSYPIVAGCMYNPNAVVTIGEDTTTGVEGIANWTTPSTSAACSGGACGFSQSYNVSLTLTIPASLSGAMTSNTFTAGDGSAGNKFTATEGTSPAPTVTYTISNSSTGAANNFYVDWIQPNGWTMTTNNCGISGSEITIAGSGNCNMIFELDTTAAAEYELNLSTAITMYWTNTGSAVQQSQALSGRIYAQVVTAPATKMIFVSTNGSAGGFGALTNADNICKSDAAGGSKTNIAGATWKALLQGNNATTVGTTYVTTMNETIATATTTNLIASGVTNNTLQHAINRDRDGTQVSQLVWTGGSATNATSSTTKNCSAWSSSLGTQKGGDGTSDSTTIWWNYVISSTTYNQPCDNVQSFYCVQQ